MTTLDHQKGGFDFLTLPPKDTNLFLIVAEVVLLPPPLPENGMLLSRLINDMLHIALPTMYPYQKTTEKVATD
jgi:hypothetical protein